jgi:hypothetical protein
MTVKQPAGICFSKLNCILDDNYMKIEFTFFSRTFRNKFSSKIKIKQEMS